MKLDTSLIHDRNDLIHNVNQFIPCDRGMVEVGTDLGAYFFQLKGMNNFDMFLIDTWDRAHFYRKTTEEEMERRYVSVLSEAISTTRYHVIRGESVAVSRAFRDDSLGFVYIDGQHHYEAVIADIKAWLPKVMVGGVLAGHDYHMAAVAVAVRDELETKYRHIVYSTTREEGRSWYMMKE